MIFYFKSKKVRNIYWKIFFIISLICFFCEILGITSSILKAVGSSSDDSTFTSSFIPILYLVFNFFIIWILELMYD